MDNFSDPNVTNKPLNTEGEMENRVPIQLCSIAAILFNGVTCPLTVLFNVLVIMAVKRRPRLQSNTNILLACLAATDVFTGLTVQPLFISWQIFQLLSITQDKIDTIRIFYSTFLRAVSVCSCLHLILVTFERLIAIKFTMRYHNIVTKQNIKFAVIALWIFTLACEVFRVILPSAQMRLNLLVAFVLLSCVLFVMFSYVILYRETRRHMKSIKAGQLPQDEVERFVRESKALKTTVFVVGSVALCFSPIVLGLFLFVSNENYDRLKTSSCPQPWIRTFAMLNSLMNPLIYCWRQREMRQFVFGTKSAPVAPAASRATLTEQGNV